jgi:hypothetical protein
MERGHHDVVEGSNGQEETARKGISIRAATVLIALSMYDSRVISAPASTARARVADQCERIKAELRAAQPAWQHVVERIRAGNI